MRRAKPTITELAFFVSGVIVILTGWLADLLGLFELGSGSGGHGSSATFSLLSFLFLGDGSLHLYALNDHLNEPFPAAFFGVFAGLQVAAAFVIPYTRRELDPAWLGITGFLIAAYVVTRTVSVWPIGTIEEVDALGLISKIVEVLTVLFLVSLMRSARAERRKTARTTAAPSR